MTVALLDSNPQVKWNLLNLQLVRAKEYASL